MTLMPHTTVKDCQIEPKKVMIYNILFPSVRMRAIVSLKFVVNHLKTYFHEIEKTYSIDVTGARNSDLKMTRSKAKLKVIRRRLKRYSNI